MPKNINPYAIIDEMYNGNLKLLKYNGSKHACTVSSPSCGHSWETSWSSLRSRNGGYTCRICFPVVGNKTAKPLSLEEANKRAKNNGLDITFLTYLHSNEPATILGKCGHQWLAKPKDVLSKHSGYICRTCNPASNSIISLEEANKRLHAIDKNITFTEYRGLQKYSAVISNYCAHSWELMLNNVETGNTKTSCPICFPTSTGISSGEKEVLQYINSIYSGWIIENDRKNITPYELDILIPDKGLAIEYNGEYWHSDDTRLLTKTNLMPDDIQLIHIFEHEWLHKQEIVKSILAAKLGIYKNKYYARNCVVKEIPFPSKFLLDNHIQGPGVPTTINYGLFYKDTLVMVATFGKPRFSSKYDLELIRMCSLKFTNIIGGASKLLSHINASSLVSYADRRYSNGNVYKKLGFTLDHVTKPNYFYYKSSRNILTRYQCQKHLLANLFPKVYDDTLSESVIMAKAGYVKVYDCGSYCFVK